MYSNHLCIFISLTSVTNARVKCQMGGFIWKKVARGEDNYYKKNIHFNYYKLTFFFFDGEPLVIF